MQGVANTGFWRSIAPPRYRMKNHSKIMMGIGTPTSHRRMERIFSPFFMNGAVATLRISRRFLAPGSLASLTSLNFHHCSYAVCITGSA